MAHSSSSKLNQTADRNANVDILRGWLIVLVIIGHIVLGSVHDNVIRYSIYAFHMPLFIGLSGYLLNPNSLNGSTFWSLITRYWHRVLLPFIVALVFFTGVLLFHAHQEGRYSTELLLSFLVTPYYHLWFIPTLVIWVIAYWLALKIKFPITIILIVCFVVTAIWAGTNKELPVAIAAMLLGKKVVYFFLFFILGAYLRAGVDGRIKKIKLLKVINDFKVLPMAIIVACACVYLLDIGFDKSPLRATVWIIMNSLLITVCTQLMIHMPKPKKRAKKASALKTSLQAMGRNSLPIYLWHVAPLFILKGLDIHQAHMVWYYLASMVSTLGICALVLVLENKNTVLNRLVYGAPS